MFVGLLPLATLVEVEAVLLTLSAELKFELLVLLLNFVNIYVLVVV